MQRGDIVTVAGRGDFASKPRPALIVQSDQFCSAHSSFTVLPLTSQPAEPVMFRVSILANSDTGLQQNSSIMVDKLQSVRRDRIGAVLGRADLPTMHRVEEALRLWLAL